MGLLGSQSRPRKDALREGVPRGVEAAVARGGRRARPQGAVRSAVEDGAIANPGGDRPELALPRLWEAGLARDAP
jgi:hypothetical protein